MKYCVKKGLNSFYHDGKKFPVSGAGVVEIPGSQIKGMKPYKAPKESEGEKG